MSTFWTELQAHHPLATVPREERHLLAQMTLHKNTKTTRLLEDFSENTALTAATLQDNPGEVVHLRAKVPIKEVLQARVATVLEVVHPLTEVLEADAAEIPLKRHWTCSCFFY